MRKRSESIEPGVKRTGDVPSARPLGGLISVCSTVFVIIADVVI